MVNLLKMLQIDKANLHFNSTAEAQNCRFANFARNEYLNFCIPAIQIFNFALSVNCQFCNLDCREYLEVYV